MKRVVIDANVLMAALGWRNEAYLCLAHIARRRAQACVSDRIADEYARITKRMDKAGLFKRSPWPTLRWYLETAEVVSPAALGKQRSRDLDDDTYIACALAARADFIISRDTDLLDLGKPFGVEIVTPRVFLNRLTHL